MSRLLHVVFLIVAALGFCLTAQQLHNVNGLAAARRGLDRQPLQQRRQDTTTSGFAMAERPTSVRDAPPPAAQAAETSTAGNDVDNDSGRSNNARSDSRKDEDQLRPTKVKTPAVETVPPTHATYTKVPVVAVAESAAATSLSDPGFLALVASLVLMTLGMALV